MTNRVKCKVVDVRVGLIIETRKPTTVVVLALEKVPDVLYSFGTLGDISNKFSVGDAVVATTEVVREAGRPPYTVIRGIEPDGNV